MITQICRPLMFALCLATIQAAAQPNCYALLLKSDTLTNAFRWEEVLPVLEEAYRICIDEHGFESDESAWVHHNLASYYFSKLKKTTADSLIEITKSLYERHCGNQSVEFGLTLMTQATMKQDDGKNLEALDNVLPALEIFRDNLGAQHFSYGAACNALGVLYCKLGYFDKGLEYLNFSLELEKNSNGTNTQRYAARLNNMALFYLQYGDYETTTQLINQAMQIVGPTKDTLSRNFLVPVINQGSLFLNTGQYEAALKHSEFFLDFLQGRHLTRQPLYYHFLNNKFSVLILTGQFEEAEKQIVIALNKLKEENSSGVIHEMLIKDNLIRIYFQTQRLAEAIDLMNEVLSNTEATSGKNSYNYFMQSVTFSLLLYHAGRNEDAMAVGEQNLRNTQSALGESSLPCTLQESVLSKIYARANLLDRAEVSARQSLLHAAKVYGEQHPQYLNFLGGMARMLYLNDKPHEANEYVAQFTRQVQANLLRFYSFFTPAEQLNYLSYSQTNIQFVENYVFSHATPELSTILFNNNLSTKGALLDDSKARRAWLLQNSDSATVVLQKEWTNIGQALAKQYALPFDQRTIKDAQILDSLQNRFQKLEQQLSDASAAFRKAFADKSSDWNTIKNKLRPNEVLIDFFSFRLYDASSDTQADSVLYCALVGRRDWAAPRLVPLFEEKQLLQRLALADEPLGSAQNVISSIYDRHLYQMLWQPLEPYLQGASTLWLCPEGALHKIAFTGIPLPNGRFAGQKYRLQMLGSPRDILHYELLEPDRINDALVYGAIQYDVSEELSDCMESKIPKNDARQLASALRNSGCGTRLPYLAGTDAESDFINSLLKNNRIETVSQKGCEASEDYFKYACRNKKGGFALIHLPTHGLFCRPPVLAVPELNKNSDIAPNPLLYSSLALAAYNRKASNRPLPPHQEDGELTAYEVSQLFLPQTQLVVLSACVSGLGETQSTEGVFGLQRAFRMAGARHVLVSLWQVDDQATNQLMQLFYHFWLVKKMDAAQALRAAQEKMRKSKEFQHPYFWAGFVFI